MLFSVAPMVTIVFPRKVRVERNSAAVLTGTYLVCLDCGKELSQDWNSMTIIESASKVRHGLRSAVSKQMA